MLNVENKISTKILCWFPLIPRLQRLFVSPKIAYSMTWHEDGRTKDGILRHLTNSFVRKDFDHEYPNFLF